LLGEAWSINQNLEWERVRYLATSIFNSRAEKASQMIKPTKLFKLPQDRLVNDKIRFASKSEVDKFVSKLRKISKENLN
jgi:hypothetical protein